MAGLSRHFLVCFLLPLLSSGETDAGAPNICDTDNCLSEELQVLRAERDVADDVDPSVQLLQRRSAFIVDEAGVRTEGETVKHHDTAGHHKKSSGKKPNSLIGTLSKVFQTKAITEPLSEEEGGVSLNGEGDLEAFIAALVTNIVTVLISFFIFMQLRTRYPLTYVRNIIKGVTNVQIPETRWGWASAALSITTEEAAENIGLDNAQLLEFSKLCMQISLVIGVPMMVIMGSLHYFCGGNAAGADTMSYLSMGNVQNGSWLYWIHCFVVWGVVIVVKTSVFSAMEKFLVRRHRWLRQLPEPRSTTVLVEQIRDDLQGETQLKDYFNKMFGGHKIKSVCIVKKSHTLASLKNQLAATEKTLFETEQKWKNDGADENKRPKTWLRSDIIETCKESVVLLEGQIKDEIDVIDQASATAGGVNAASGFVTFHERKDADIARTLIYSSDMNSMIVSVPPQPSSIIWADLQQDPNAAVASNTLGHLMVLGLYLAYLPMVIGITNIANIIDMGPMQPIWEGLAPTLGLTIMVGFLPTFLILIYRACYTLKDDAWAQLRLQSAYFVFQVVFVILITAIGTDVVGFTRTALEDPFGLPMVFAEVMPSATHFYMNYIVLQWAAHAMNMIRYVMLTKWFLFKQLHDDETACDMAEPEDQDYYGIGSRSARHAIMMLIGLIFGTLCPPMNVLVFVNFAISRLVYGYLINIAEQKKPDLGGCFFVNQLNQLFVGCIIYIILMTGVLYGRAETGTPSIIAFFSLFYVIASWNRFQTQFSWESLPFSEVVHGHFPKSKNEVVENYLQPELVHASK